MIQLNAVGEYFQEKMSHHLNLFDPELKEVNHIELEGN